MLLAFLIYNDGIGTIMPDGGIDTGTRSGSTRA